LPARALCPAISEVLSLLDRTGAMLVRMSGSGATCFALYRDARELQAAADLIRTGRGEWWQLTGKLR